MSKLSKTCYKIIKRLFDIVFSIIGCVFLVPIAIVVKTAYMISGDFSPIFYKHERIGKNGKPIYIFKIRSMIPNADIVLKKLLEDSQYITEWIENQKIENDPRVTKIGRFLRKTSLDEIPQFINVLIGNMSLVGPRPLVKGELSDHGGNPEIYESIRPGITGWWAANGRSSISYDERLELEYYYIKNRSLLLDLKCLFKTIFAVISKKGAQ